MPAHPSLEQTVEARPFSRLGFSHAHGEGQQTSRRRQPIVSSAGCARRSAMGDERHRLDAVLF
jgi:hypothetical protein